MLSFPDRYSIAPVILGIVGGIAGVILLIVVIALLLCWSMANNRTKSLTPSLPYDGYGRRPVGFLQ